MPTSTSARSPKPASGYPRSKKRSRRDSAMCGIVGVMDLKARREIPRTLIARMNETQHHRGPDAGGLHLEPGLGSELKSLVAHPGLARELDPYAIEEYFALGYVPEPRTIYAGAKKLPPGHTLTVRRGRPVPAPREYWDVRFTLDNPVGEHD